MTKHFEQYKQHFLLVAAVALLLVSGIVYLSGKGSQARALQGNPVELKLMREDNPLANPNRIMMRLNSPELRSAKDSRTLNVEIVAQKLNDQGSSQGLLDFIAHTDEREVLEGFYDNLDGYTTTIAPPWPEPVRLTFTFTDGLGYAASASIDVTEISAVNLDYENIVNGVNEITVGTNFNISGHIIDGERYPQGVPYFAAYIDLNNFNFEPENFMEYQLITDLDNAPVTDAQGNYMISTEAPDNLSGTYAIVVGASFANLSGDEDLRFNIYRQKVSFVANVEEEIGNIKANVTSNDAQANGMPRQVPLEGAVVKAFNKDDSCAAEYLPNAEELNENCTPVSTCVTNAKGICYLSVFSGQYYVLAEEENHAGMLPGHSVGQVTINEEKLARISFLKETPKNEAGNKKKK